MEDIFRPRIAAMPDALQNVVVQFMTRRHYKMYKKVGWL